MFGGVPLINRGSETRQTLGRRIFRKIGSGHCIPEVHHHLGNAAHSCAADADKVQVFDNKFHNIRSLHRFFFHAAHGFNQIRDGLSRMRLH